MTRRKKILLILLILTVLGGSIAWSIWFRDPFPDPSEISRVTLVSYSPSPGRHVAFDFSYGDWLMLCNTLTTPIWNAAPANSVGLAHLLIYTHDNMYNLWLFDTDQPRGAFSLAPSMANPTYYRAGDMAAIKRALTAAYQAASERGQVRTLNAR